MLTIALNQSLNEPLTQGTSMLLAVAVAVFFRFFWPGWPF